MNTTTLHEPAVEGLRVACVARDGAKVAVKGGRCYPIWTGGIYQTRRRVRDGLITWRRVGSFGGSRSGFGPSARFLTELRSQAPAPFVDRVRHGQPAVL